MKNTSYLLPIAVLSILTAAQTAAAARNDKQDCTPEPGVCYSKDECACYTCLGPDNIMINAPVRPKTCNGDFVITLAGFYWNANQDGMEYAIENEIKFPEFTFGTGGQPPTNASIQEVNNLIDAKYRTPDYKWDFGFKFGLGYNTTCDGWDIGAVWTWYRGRALDHVEAEPDDNRVLLPLWSSFAPTVGLNLYASDIQSKWKVQFNLVDIELGREFWTSKYVTLRPFIGFRVAYINQIYEIRHRGGSWSAHNAIFSNSTGDATTAQQSAFNNFVDINNRFRGFGARGGLDSVWNLGCGWAIFGDFAANLVYGRFSIDHKEYNRLAEDEHTKTLLLDTDKSFRAARAMVDLALGIQFATTFCDCQYGFVFSLGWENHIFLDQNQMWRVMRIGDENQPGNPTFPDGSNNTGENIFHQRRGDLSTQGWTLTLRFEF